MTDTTAQIDKLKSMPHLDKLREEAQSAVGTANAPQETNAPREPDPRDAREYVFSLKYVDGRGKHWEGEFKNKILTLRDRQQVGILRARLADGLPLTSLDILTAEINLMLAHTAYSLIEWPDWAGRENDDRKKVLALDKLDDVELLQAIYAEVDSHEAYFRGRR